MINDVHLRVTEESSGKALELIQVSYCNNKKYLLHMHSTINIGTHSYQSRAEFMANHNFENKFHIRSYQQTRNNFPMLVRSFSYS
jgi:hypothetical protein